MVDGKDKIKTVNLESDELMHANQSIVVDASEAIPERDEDELYSDEGRRVGEHHRQRTHLQDPFLSSNKKFEKLRV